MVVSKEFQNHNFEVRQSHYYEDFQTKEHREIDILATSSDFLGYAEVSFLIECKISKKPWILFTSDNTISGYNRLFALGITSEKARDVLVQDKSENLFKSALFKKSGRIAYGATVAFTNGQDTAYKASMSAIKAAVGRKNELSSSSRVFNVTFPVIVVDCPLFECYLSETNEVIVEEISESYLFYHNHLDKEPATCIKVLQVDCLESFCTEAAYYSKIFLDIFEPEIKKEHHKIARGKQ